MPENGEQIVYSLLRVLMPIPADKHTLRPTYNTIDQGGNDWVTKPDVKGWASTNNHIYDQRNATVKESISQMVQSGESITRVQVQASDYDGTF